MADSQLTTAEKVESLWKLGGLTWRELLRRTGKEIQNDDILGRASELAYNFVLSIFPLLLFLLAVMGLLASRGTQLRNMLFGGLASVVPPSAWQLVSKTLNEVTQSSGGGKITIGVIFFLWSASAGTSSMISALNAAYGLRDSRPWWRVKLLALELTLGMSTLVFAALVIVLFGGQIADFVNSYLGLHSAAVTAWKIIQWPIALAFVILAFALV